VPRFSEPDHDVDGVHPEPVQYFPPVNGDGNASDTVTFAASDGPAFDTDSV
jgi:hypothetical protein